MLALGNGTTTYTTHAFLDMDIDNCVIAAADIDNDGDQDLLFGNLVLRNERIANSIRETKSLQANVFPNPVAKNAVDPSKRGDARNCEAGGYERASNSPMATEPA